MGDGMPHPAFRPQARSQSGAFDLPSILIGVAVVAILAVGVMAAVFGVIPWAQDRAAQQDLAAVSTAQGTAYAHGGSFAGKDALVSAGWLGQGTPAALDTKTDADGKCYVAVTKSRAGTRYIVSSDKPDPRPAAPGDRWCSGAPVTPDTEPVMISTWDTGFIGSCKEITLPVTGFKGTVSWGDGTSDSKLTHTYAKTGKATIRIDGTFTAWGGETWSDAACIVSVDRWGATETTDLSYMFNNAVQLKHVESVPPTAATLAYGFYNVSSGFTLGYLDTANVTDMKYLFGRAYAFNQPVTFDTSRVTDMSWMFSDARAFNQPLDLDTSRVTNMYGMFYGASSFNQRLTFDTSGVTEMGTMFYNAVSFNQPVEFDTSKVTRMYAMFYLATSFNQPVAFDTAKVTNMNAMFREATSFNQPLRLNTSQVTTVQDMFFGAGSFLQDLSAWDVRKVELRGNFASDSYPAALLPKFRAS